MAITVDHDEACKILADCWNKREHTDDEIGRTISRIIYGDHLTYRYILVNALLAKATNVNVNALALQAKAPIKGSYDARSLCHKVLVPFDKQKMSCGLGGSNEPFLNKPARFEMLSKTNAVRNGNDRQTLETLIGLLPRVKDSDEAKKYLRSALFDVAKLAASKEQLYTFERNGNDDLMNLLSFIAHLARDSKQGVIPVLIVTALEKMLYAGNENISIQPHKVNQAGSSSKEIGDIDIYDGRRFVTAIEVKDKDFTDTDLKHAVDKSLTHGSRKFMFVYGPHANYERKSILELIDEYAQKGVICILISLMGFSRLALFNIPHIDRDTFIEAIMEVAREINCTPDVLGYIKTAIADI